MTLPSSLPIGARTMKAIGIVTIMVQNGVKTVDSTSGMTFLKNFSTKYRTGTERMIGRTDCW